MKPFSGYEEVKANTFEASEKLNLGGHTCRIISAETQNVTFNSGKTCEQLIIKFDIYAPDEQAGFYERKYKIDAEKDALNAKWKGVFRQNLPTDDGTELDNKIKSIFKGIITSVEESNPGFKWAWDEKSLAGKLFGGVFGLREFQNPMGDIIAFTELRFFRSTKEIEKAAIPSVRLLDGSYLKYEDYEKRKASGETTTTNNGPFVDTASGDIDTLPF